MVFWLAFSNTCIIPSDYQLDLEQAIESKPSHVNDIDIYFRHLLSGCRKTENRDLLVMLFGINDWFDIVEVLDQLKNHSLNFWSYWGFKTTNMCVCVGFRDWVPKELQRVGCVELLNTVQKRVRPKLHAFGGIHEGTEYMSSIRS